MKQRLHVRIAKIGQNPNPDVPTPEWTDYVLGSSDGHTSLPLAYTCEGTLLCDIKVGSPVVLARTHRNGLEIPGRLETSPVTNILATPGQGDSHWVTTHNSIYRVDVIEDEKSLSSV